MKATTRGLLLAVVGTGLLAVLAVVGIWVAGGFDGFARAQGPVIVGFDMDPTGNSCPGDGVSDCSLGAIDPCIEVDVAANPATFSIDVFLEGLPAADSILGFEYGIEWGPPDFLDMNTQTHNSKPVNLVAQGGHHSIGATRCLTRRLLISSLCPTSARPSTTRPIPAAPWAATT